MNRESLLLGRIKEVHKYFLVLSLPHERRGKCDIGEISESYSKLLQTLSKNAEESVEEIPELSDLFEIGQYLQVKVLKSDKSSLELTLMPTKLNFMLVKDQIKNNMNLQMAVKSIEDKGYILESGVNGLNAFLSFDKCEGELRVGQIIPVKPLNVGKGDKNARSINFKTFNRNADSYPIIQHSSMNFQCILPSMLFSTKIDKTEKNEHSGKIADFQFVIKSDHCRNVKVNTPEQIVCVIGRDFENKIIDCSVLPHMIPPFRESNDLTSVEIGFIDKNATVKQILHNKDIILASSNENYGDYHVPKKQIDRTDSKVEVDQSVEARVMDYNLIDYSIQASMLKKVLSLAYLNVQEANMGDIVTGTILRYTVKGYKIRISSTVHGFLPNNFITDTNSATLKTLFTPGEEIKAQVIYVDSVEKTLILSTKKSIMKSKLPKNLSIETIQKGMTVDAVVAKVLQYGIVVNMCGNLKGWLAINDVPAILKESTEVTFPIGKYLKLNIDAVDVDNSKIRVKMFNVNTEDHENENNTKFKVGAIYKCKIIQVMKAGFSVRLLPMKTHASLPFEQLSDSRDNRCLLQAVFSKESEQKQRQLEVVIVSTEGTEVIVSAKHSMVSAAHQGQMLIDTSCLQVGSQWLGWVQNHTEYGMFVMLPSGARGLVPSRCLPVNRLTSAADVFESGDTVSVLVTKIDHTNHKKCQFSMRMFDTYRAVNHLDSQTIPFVASIFNERRLIQQSSVNSKVKTVRLGSVVEVKITSRLDWGYLFTMVEPAEVNGFVRNEHLSMNELLTPGTHCKGVVIDVNLADHVIEITTTSSIVNATLHRSDNVRINVGDKVRADVVSIHADYVTAHLVGHVAGRLVQLPASRFWNDVGNQRTWVYNQRNNVVIKAAIGEYCLIGSLEVNEPLKQEKKTIKKESKKLEEPHMEDDDTNTKQIEGFNFDTLELKFKVDRKTEYPVYFLHKLKDLVFFSLSKKQRGVCNVLEYSNCLTELEIFLDTLPNPNKYMGKSARVLRKGHKINNSFVCTLLAKNILEVGDEVCGRVKTVFNQFKFRVALPYKRLGEVYLNKSKKPCIYKTPERGQYVQCRIDAIEVNGKHKKYILALLKIGKIISNKSDDTRDSNSDEEILSDNEDDTMAIADEVENMEVKKEEENKPNNSRKRKLSVESENTDKHTIKKAKLVKKAHEMKLVKSFEEVKKGNITDLLEQIKTTNDDSFESEDGGECEDTGQFSDNEHNSETHEVEKKKPELSAVEKEIQIREAERRRETGEISKKPQNEIEFELFVFNNPKDANSWLMYLEFLQNNGPVVEKFRLKYLEFLQNNGGDVEKCRLKYLEFLQKNGRDLEKCRSIAERAYKSLNDQDKEGRFKIQQRALELEADLVGVLDSDEQLAIFNQCLDKTLTTKVQATFEFVIGKLLALKQYALCEKIAKRYIKEFQHEYLVWFQLCNVRYIQKNYFVVKETMINAERILNKNDYRLLKFRLAKLELENDQNNRAFELCKVLVQEKPTDKSMRDAIEHLLVKYKCPEYLEIIQNIEVPTKMEN